MFHKAFIEHSLITIPILFISFAITCTAGVVIGHYNTKIPTPYLGAGTRTSVDQKNGEGTKEMNLNYSDEEGKISPRCVASKGSEEEGAPSSLRGSKGNDEGVPSSLCGVERTEGWTRLLTASPPCGSRVVSIQE